jgi:hypothetical protein
LAALEIEMARQNARRQTKIGIIAVFIGGAALLSIVMLAVFFRGKAPTLQSRPLLAHLLTPIGAPLSLRHKMPS